MKRIELIIWIGLGVLMSSCKDDVAAAGADVLSNTEEVRVCANVFSQINSTTVGTDSLNDFKITQTPDSFLLGEVNTEQWATIKADLLTQFACPEGVALPEGSVIDSIALVMTYSSWFAEGTSPLRVSVYEMDLNTFDYNGIYNSELNIDDYISSVDDNTHAVKEDKVVVAAYPDDSIYSSSLGVYYPVIRFKMNDRFVNKMRGMKQGSRIVFPTQREFNRFFKGLYITTTYGASTALYVGNITMIMYYSYQYQGLSTAGEDSTYIANDAKYLYANAEVRQVNRYSFKNKDIVIRKLQTIKDTNFVVSPGYVYTVLNLPMKQYVDTITESMQTDRGEILRPFINKALMRVEVLNVNTSSTTSDKWADPADYMLLISKDSLQTFFTNHNLPSSDYCILSSLDAKVNEDYTYSYFYDFDVSTMLYNEVRKKEEGESVEDLEMVMVPVQVEYTTTSSSTSVSQVKLDQTITFTAIHSAQYETNPLDIDVVYTGFGIKSM